MRSLYKLYNFFTSNLLFPRYYPLPRVVRISRIPPIRSISFFGITSKNRRDAIDFYLSNFKTKSLWGLKLYNSPKFLKIKVYKADPVLNLLYELYDFLLSTSVRFEPSSRIILIGEQPNPWDLLQPQDMMSRHRGAELRRRYGRLGGTSLLSPE